MTCIAYTKGVLAADTRATDTDGMVLKSKKIEHLKNGTVVGCAGDSDARDVLDLLGKATLTKWPTKNALAKTETVFQGIWVFPEDDKVFIVEIELLDGKWTAEIRPLLDACASVGSGSRYAMGAMLAGKSAVDAVKIACRLDSSCGLPVESFKTKDTV